MAKRLMPAECVMLQKAQGLEVVKGKRQKANQSKDMCLQIQVYLHTSIIPLTAY